MNRKLIQKLLVIMSFVVWESITPAMRTNNLSDLVGLMPYMRQNHAWIHVSDLRPRVRQDLCRLGRIFNKKSFNRLVFDEHFIVPCMYEVCVTYLLMVACDENDVDAVTMLVSIIHRECIKPLPIVTPVCESFEYIYLNTDHPLIQKAASVLCAQWQLIEYKYRAQNPDERIGIRV